MRKGTRMTFIEASQQGSFTNVEEGGPHWVYKFDNGYGATVITRPLYGFEIAVLDKDNKIVYDTPVTDNVAYANSFAAVDVILEAIYDLKPEVMVSISAKLLREWRDKGKNIIDSSRSAIAELASEADKEGYALLISKQGITNLVDSITTEIEKGNKPLHKLTKQAKQAGNVENTLKSNSLLSVHPDLLDLLR
jgi:hypothetical protein